MKPYLALNVVLEKSAHILSNFRYASQWGVVCLIGARKFAHKIHDGQLVLDESELLRRNKTGLIIPSLARAEIDRGEVLTYCPFPNKILMRQNNT